MLIILSAPNVLKKKKNEYHFVGFRNADNISCKTLFFSEKLQTFTNHEKFFDRKSVDNDFGKINRIINLIIK